MLTEPYKIQPLPTLRFLFTRSHSLPPLSVKTLHFPLFTLFSALTCMDDSFPSFCSHLRYPILRETSLITIVIVSLIYKSPLMAVIKEVPKIFIFLPFSWNTALYLLEVCGLMGPT